MTARSHIVRGKAEPRWYPLDFLVHFGQMGLARPSPESHLFTSSLFPASVAPSLTWVTLRPGTLNDREAREEEEIWVVTEEQS